MSFHPTFSSAMQLRVPSRHPFELLHNETCQQSNFAPAISPSEVFATLPISVQISGGQQALVSVQPEGITRVKDRT